MSPPQEPSAEPGLYARRDELATLAGEVKTMEAHINERANAESARIVGEIKAQRAKHSAELRAILEAIKSMEKSMDLQMTAMEERHVARMKESEERHVARMKESEERRVAHVKEMEERRVAHVKEMEERRIAHINAIEDPRVAEIDAPNSEIILEIRKRANMRILKWSIVLILAFVVPTFVGAFLPLIGALLFGG